MSKILTTLDNIFNALSMAILWIAGIILAGFIIYKLAIWEREYDKELIKEAIEESK